MTTSNPSSSSSSGKPRVSMFDKDNWWDLMLINYRRKEVAFENGRPECVKCETHIGVAMRPSHTAYDYKGAPGSPEDPNRDIPLCDSCAKEHDEYWQSMWDEYYNSR